MIHKEVSLIFFHTGDKILLQDRRNISKLGEEWGFFGGSLEKGETPEQAIVRETQEELGFLLKKCTFIKTSHHTMGERTFTVHAFTAPCPDLSAFVQNEGQGMKLVTEQEARQLKLNKPDYDILTYVFAFIRALR